MNVSPATLSHSELYGLILNSVAPRPIAWVSTLSASGQPNLAPFSFFNCVCVEPALLAFAPGLRTSQTPGAAHGEAKDTLRNVRETNEFVVNIVTYELAGAMNLTSGEYDASVNEFELAQIATAPSQAVKAPRVAASPVSFECRLSRILDFSPSPAVSAERQPRDRGDRFDPRGRHEYERREARPQFAGPDRAHGRDSIYEDDSEV